MQLTSCYLEILIFTLMLYIYIYILILESDVYFEVFFEKLSSFFFFQIILLLFFFFWVNYPKSHQIEGQGTIFD